MGLLWVVTFYLELTTHAAVTASAPLYVICFAALACYVSQLFIRKY